MKERRAGVIGLGIGSGLLAVSLGSAAAIEFLQDARTNMYVEGADILEDGDAADTAEFWRNAAGKPSDVNGESLLSSLEPWQRTTATVGIGFVVLSAPFVMIPSAGRGRSSVS